MIILIRQEFMVRKAEGDEEKKNTNLPFSLVRDRNLKENLNFSLEGCK